MNTSCCSFEHSLLGSKVAQAQRSMSQMLKPHVMEEDFLNKNCGSIVKQWQTQLNKGSTETAPSTSMKHSSTHLEQSRNNFLQKMNSIQGSTKTNIHSKTATSTTITTTSTSTSRRPPSLIIPRTEMQERPSKQRRHSVTSCSSTPSSTSSCSVESFFIDSPFSVSSEYSFSSSATLWSPTGGNLAK